MNKEHRLAIVTASAARAIIKALAMQAENQREESFNRTGQYRAKDFLEVIEDEGLTGSRVDALMTQEFTGPR